jgi:CXXC-20-CXXC protein
MMKGLKCTNCGCEFNWNDATERKIQGVKSICNCPKCNQLIASDITAIKIIALIAFAILFFVLLLWSILNTTPLIIIIVAASGFILSYFIEPIFFKDGYMQMFKVKE